MKIKYDEFMSSEARSRSPELDFGVWWRGIEPYPVYRLSWIEKTGELYLKGADDIEILAIITDEFILADLRQQNRLYSDLRVGQVLAGWIAFCGRPNSIEWIKARLRQHGYLLPH